MTFANLVIFAIGFVAGGFALLILLDLYVAYGERESKRATDPPRSICVRCQEHTASYCIHCLADSQAHAVGRIPKPSRDSKGRFVNREVGA